MFDWGLSIHFTITGSYLIKLVCSHYRYSLVPNYYPLENSCCSQSVALLHKVMLTTGIFVFTLYLWGDLSLSSCPGCPWCICAKCQPDRISVSDTTTAHPTVAWGMKCKGKFVQKLNNWVPWLPISKQKCQILVLNLCSDFFHQIHGTGSLFCSFIIVILCCSVILWRLQHLM